MRCGVWREVVQLFRGGDHAELHDRVVRETGGLPGLAGPSGGTGRPRAAAQDARG